MAVISVGIVMLTGLLILVISSCLLKFESNSPKAVILSARDYLTAGPVSLAFAVLIVTVEFAVALTGIRAQSRSDFGLPNVNLWAYFAYAFLHADTRHVLENAGSLLICGGIVESNIRSLWFLVLIAFSIPIGGALTTLAAPVFIESISTGDPPSVGFSIVVYATLVLCLYFVIEVMLKEQLFKLACERWKRLSATAIVLLFFSCSFVTGVLGSSGESILGHCIGITQGTVAVTVYWLRHRSRRQGTA